MTQDSGASSADALARRADQMQQQLDQLRKLQATARMQTLVVVVIIVLMFVVFMWATYSRIRGNFDQASVQKVVRERADEFLPKATDRLTKAAQAAAPTYRELAMARLQTVGPQIAADAQVRFEKVPKESGDVMKAELDKTFKKVTDRLEPDVKEAFPSLTDDRRKAILESFHADVDAENTKIKSHVDQIYTTEMVKLHGVMDKFNSSVAPGQQKAHAEREFLHALIMYVDFLITDGDSLPDHTAKPSGIKQAAAPATQASAK